MCTHDPAAAFRALAAVCHAGATLYVMVYAPEGMHGLQSNLELRRQFATLSLNEKIAMALRLAKGSRSAAIGWFDALNPFYNWVIPEEVAVNWFRAAGFGEIRVLNAAEHPRCAHHIAGVKL